MLENSLFSRRQVNLIRQSEVTECGHACLAMILGYHGHPIDLGTLRRKSPTTLRGSTMRSIIHIATSFGLAARPVKLPLDSLGGLELPAILHWDLNHFVVVERVRGGRALIHDPAGSSQWRRLADISRHFTGVALEVRTTSAFDRADERRTLKIREVFHGISGQWGAILHIGLLTAVMQAFILASPYYLQLAVDKAVPTADQDLLTLLALGFGLFVLVHVASQLIRSISLLSIGTAVGLAVSTNVARKLFRLPLSWFERRHAGDILSRFQSVVPLQQALTQGALAALIDGAMAITVLAVMAFYSVPLTLVVLIAFGLYTVVRALTYRAQKSAQEQSLISRSLEQTNLLETLRGMTVIRLLNKESVRMAMWQSRLIEALNGQIRVLRLGAWQASLNSLIFAIENVLVVWLTMRIVIDGGFSMGMAFAFIAYKAVFTMSGSSFIDHVAEFRMLGLHLHRLSDIVLAEEDRCFKAHEQPYRPLLGRIELEDLSFRYGESEPLVLSGVNLSIGPGEHIAITGPSGGGKTTLSKLICGLLEAETGRVLVDGRELEKFGIRNFHDQIGTVLQEDCLFSGSIADNIALLDEEPNHERVVESAVLASIHRDILGMPMGYETLIGEMGAGLSGGQKQRILLARALYRNPKLLVVDEGTSHLDAEREEEVNQAIAGAEITRIVIAHRLETILAADRIYRLENARLTDVTDEYDALRDQRRMKTVRKKVYVGEAHEFG